MPERVAERHKGAYDIRRPYANARINSWGYVLLDNYYKYGRLRERHVNEVDSGTNIFQCFNTLSVGLPEAAVYIVIYHG